jgi:hypothetical protein
MYLVSRVRVPRIPCLHTSYPVFVYPISRVEAYLVSRVLIVGDAGPFGDAGAVLGVPGIPYSVPAATRLFRG